MAIKDLRELIKNINPEVIEGNYVFCVVNETVDMKIVPKMIFKEKEGTTLILTREQAEEYGLKYEGMWAMITLNVNSDLEAVGFLAKITEVLAKANISVNTVSAYYHDHLFVPKERVEDALEILNKLKYGEF
jgi:uncharacterized protein